MFVQQLIRAVAPWQSLYSDSKAVSTAVTSVHILSLLFGGGLAIAADRLTLRVARKPANERALQLEELRAVHRPVLIALTLLVASGVLLFAADLKTFIETPIFWVKLSLVIVLLINGIVLARTEITLRKQPELNDGLWNRMRVVSIASFSLWMLTAAAGTVLAGFA